MKRLLSLIAATIFIVSSSYSQTAAELSSRIKSAVENREYVVAIDLLRKFREQDPEAFEANNYDYLLGRMAEKSGDLSQAVANFQSVAARGSVLSPYSRWHEAQAARSTGNLMLERLTIVEIITSSPTSLVVSTANNRLARSFFESGNYPEAIRLLTSPIKTVTPQNSKVAENAFARESLLLLADAYAAANRAGEARDAYNKLLNEMPNAEQPDDFALAAAKALDGMDGGITGKSAPKLADTEHLRRANIYQFNRDFAPARLHFQAIINNFPSGGIVPDAIFQIGRSYAQQGEYIEAIKWFERVEEQFPEHPSAKDALLQAGSCYSKVGKFKEAIGRYRRFIELYPNEDRIDRAYLNIVDIYRDAGSEQDALKWAAATEQAFRGKLPEAIAVFGAARIYLARSDWTNALSTLDRLETFPDLGGIKVPAGTNSAEVDFLRGFCLEQLRRYDEAVEVYLSIPDGRAEYYGGRATQRLLLLAENQNAKASIGRKIVALNDDAMSKDPEIARKALQSLLRISDSRDERAKQLDGLRNIYKTLPAYHKIPSFGVSAPGRSALPKDAATTIGASEHRSVAEALLFLGLYDEAGSEVEASLAPDSDKNGDIGYSLAVIYNRGDTANRAVAFVEPLWRGVPADYQIDLLPRDQLELLYPAPYADSLLRYASPRQVDPRIVLSIIRQESRYRPQVKSNAAARGLMQFISTTSDKIAAELGRDDFGQDELYDPPTAILFGSQYLADLFRQFPGQPAAVAASYNGGDDNVKRWVTRSKTDSPDRYVPEIIFSQSKDYVYKVMSNYRMYQLIRDEELKAR
ncbi:MAG: tetratricopeptide repeat protein [Acidobacteriota bacterium]